MRIAIEATRLELAGGGRFTAMGLIQGILEQDRKNRYLVFLNREEECLRRFPNVEQRIIGEQNRFAVRMMAQLTLPRLLRNERVDLVHFVKNLGTFFVPCKSVVTIYDLTILKYPQFFPWADVAYWRGLQPLFLESVDRIGTLSESTKRDLIKYYKLRPEKIQVIYSACDPRFRVLSRSRVGEVRHRYSLPEDFVLSVGNISPKKNFGTLIRAFALLKKRYALRHKMVIAGREYWPGGQRPLNTLARELGVEDEVIFLGTVVGDDLAALYNAASAFAFPSLDEGFGLVLAEAMACGVPVIASGTSAIPEVVGDAGLLLRDPLDIEELASAMARILTDPAQREDMSQRGLRQVHRFSWREAGLEYLKMYESLVG